MPRAREMVDLLILIYSLKLISLNESGPEHIPGRARHQAETRGLQRVYHAVVDMGGVVDLEAEK